MWDVHRNIDLAALPDREVLVQFSFPDAPRGSTRFWLHLKGGEVDLCLTHPGFAVDLVVEASVLAMTRVWLGRHGLREAMRSGEVRVTGDRKCIADFPRWLALSSFASVPAVDA